MKQKKIPMRTCVVTKEKYPKMELIRIVRTPSNEIVIDLKGKNIIEKIKFLFNEFIFYLIYPVKIIK